MCYAVRCRTCGGTTWSGCGQHVEQVRAGIPDEQWCPGHEDTERGGWLRRLRTNSRRS